MAYVCDRAAASGEVEFFFVQPLVLGTGHEEARFDVRRRTREAGIGERGAYALDAQQTARFAGSGVVEDECAPEVEQDGFDHAWCLSRLLCKGNRNAAGEPGGES